MSRSDGAGLRPETLTVGLGYDPASARGSAKPPIYMTSTFVYETAQHAKDVHRRFFDGPAEGEAEDPAFIYARLGNPNLTMVETRLAALDRAEAAAGFCSGMAAISTVLMAHVRPGDSILHGLPVYSGADGLMNGVLARFGVNAFHFTDGLDAAALAAAMEAAAAAGPLRLIWLESPANPTGAMIDLALAARLAGEIGARQGFRPLIVVDNTFLGPLLQSPLDHGADLVMTSLTKYCGGHSDLLAGGVSGRLDLVAPLRALRTSLGNHMDPHTAWLLLRSLETLHLRTERSCANALSVARFLAGHEKVAKVNFVGLAPADSPRARLMARQCRGAGSTFSFDIRGGEAEAFRFLDRLKLLRLAVSLGGSETLICHSATTTHYAVDAARRLEGGITDATLRLSIGLEHEQDLIDDLAQALEAV